MATFRCKLLGPGLAVALLASSCGGSTDTSEGATEVESESTATQATEVSDTTETANTEPEASAPAGDAEAQVLELEFSALEPGAYLVETIGAPFTVTIPNGFWVQPNANGLTVLTDKDSRGPGDRDIVFLRSSGMSDPAEPSVWFGDLDELFPNDLDAWLAGIPDGIVSAGPSMATLGGLEATTFDVFVDPSTECSEEECISFATNRLVNWAGFATDINYRVFWIDGDDESPVVVVIGDGGDETFLDTAAGVLESVEFMSIGPNPIPSEGNLWELGIESPVPAGSVTLPIGPGVTFEISDDLFIAQRPGWAGLFPEAAGEVDIFFPTTAHDGSVTDSPEAVIDAINSAEGHSAEATGTRIVAGVEATEIAITGPGSFSGDAILNPDEATDVDGWRSPPSGIMWVIPTDGGIAVVTAEFGEASATELVTALAGEVLDSLSIG